MDYKKIAKENLITLFIIFIALFWKQGKFQTNIQTGVCEYLIMKNGYVFQDLI